MTMPDAKTIYQQHAERYDELVAKEDRDGQLPRALGALIPLPGAQVLELGAGTGRITRQLLELGVARVAGVDQSAAMLAVARQRLQSAGYDEARWQLSTGDVTGRRPAALAASGWADAAVAGWVFGHFCHWLPATWRQAAGTALGHMRRALKPAGVLLVIETLGTGTPTATVPEQLAGYYRWLEQDQGMHRTVIRTDYQFGSVAEAVALTRFFFGGKVAAEVARQGLCTVPEHTGIWHTGGRAAAKIGTGVG